jgi:hypothetical protein
MEVLTDPTTSQVHVTKIKDIWCWECWWFSTNRKCYG